MSKLRIGVGGIATESCTFSSLLTMHDDFTILCGRSICEHPHYAELIKLGATIIPTRYACALPGGPVERIAYEQLKDEFLTALQDAGPIHGLYLDFHGAMNVVGMDDAEANYLSAARHMVGPRCLICVSYDLHANISQASIDVIDMMTAYRTAPHIDVTETKRRACRLLVHSLRNNIRPKMRRIHIPVGLSGERTSTEFEPAASLYASLPQIASRPGILDASLLVGYIWADEPRTGACVVVTGTDNQAIDDEARQLAQRYWNARSRFKFGVPTGTIGQCIRWARETDESCIFITDSGDNPTGGGVGDLPVCLDHLVVADVPDVVIAGIADAPATQAAYAAGEGANLELVIGGTLTPSASQAVRLHARVRYLDHNSFPRGRQAVLQSGGVTIIVTEKRRPFHYLADFEHLGIELQRQKIIVVKMGYLVPDLKQVASHTFMALSPGAVDQAIDHLFFKRIRRPIFPLDSNFHWQPQVANG